jgi:two-component system, LytTR family, sensor kinase
MLYAMQRIKNLLRLRFFRHLIFIILIFVSQIIQIEFVVNTKFTEIYWLFVVKDTIANLLHFYSFAYVLIPNISKLRLYPILIATLVLAYFYGYASNFYMFRLVGDHNAYSVLSIAGFPTITSIKALEVTYRSMSLWEGFFDGSMLYMTITYYSGFISYLIFLKAMKDFYTLQLKNINYKASITRLELDFLKTQINPHFLFNTLNNVYSMIAYKDTLAAESVLCLSDMMRYSLYETNNEKVSLAKEVEFIENYLCLEKIRHGKYVVVEHEITENLQQYNIAPFLLIVLIENAFKHGILPAPTHSYISIKLSKDDDDLHFIVKNTKKSNTEEKTIGGVGFKNLQRRLVLLYPDTHKLEIAQTDTEYSAHLRLQGLFRPI